MSTDHEDVWRNIHTLSGHGLEFKDIKMTTFKRRSDIRGNIRVGEPCDTHIVNVGNRLDSELDPSNVMLVTGTEAGERLFLEHTGVGAVDEGAEQQVAEAADAAEADVNELATLRTSNRRLVQKVDTLKRLYGALKEEVAALKRRRVVHVEEEGQGEALVAEGVAVPEDEAVALMEALQRQVEEEEEVAFEADDLMQALQMQLG